MLKIPHGAITEKMLDNIIKEGVDSLNDLEFKLIQILNHVKPLTTSNDKIINFNVNLSVSDLVLMLGTIATMKDMLLNPKRYVTINSFDVKYTKTDESEPH